MNNPTRATKLDDLAHMIEMKLRFENMPRFEQKQEQLNRLRTFVRQLAGTPQGRLDLEQRLRLLGPCEPTPDDDAATFYGKLRRWLDVDLTHRLEPAEQR